VRGEEFLQIHRFSLSFYLSRLFLAASHLHSFAFLGLLITVNNHFPPPPHQRFFFSFFFI